MPFSVFGAGIPVASRMVGTDVDQMVELPADAARVVDVAGPRDRHALCRAAEVRRHLLRPLERRVHRPRPRCGKVREGLIRAPERVRQSSWALTGTGNAVEGGELVRRAVERTFGAGTVVAADVDDQRVVELAHVVDGLNHAADLVVGVGEVGGVNVRLPDEQPLLVRREIVPLGRSFGHGVNLRVLGNDAEPLLIGKYLSRTISSPVEQMHVPELQSIRSRVMRRVCSARRVVEEKRLVGANAWISFTYPIASSAMAVIRFQPGLPTLG